MSRSKIAAASLATVLSAALVLTACSSDDPLDTTPAPDGDSPSATTIVVGSAAFAESEILAYLYAGALEARDFTVEVRPSIGARDAYIAALEDGSIDLVPEYTGNLLQFFDPDATAQSAADVHAALVSAVPEGFVVGRAAEAANADSYNVTREFSDQYGVTSLADLAGVPEPIVVAANPELAERPYGIPGLRDVYGVEATLLPINDGGGPNTLAALLDGTVQVADIYSTTPSIAENDLVTLADPENMVLAQNIVPLGSADVITDEVLAVLDVLHDALTTADLIEMNTRSSGDARDAARTIAQDWLAASGLFG